GGGLVALALLRREALRLLWPALAAFALALVPLGLQNLSRPAQREVSPGYLGQAVLYLEPGQTRPGEVRFGELPRPMLLNFWATWCPPCRAEMPLLAEYQEKGYPIVLLNVGESTSAVQAFMGHNGLSVRVFLDPGGLQRAFGVSGLPTTLLLDAEGKVEARHLGPVNRAQLEALLRRLHASP
ncbi:MAG: TlpA family protein disulfide reductase, partial [Deinococcus-Thermus bacterium]